MSSDTPLKTTIAAPELIRPGSAKAQTQFEDLWSCRNEQDCTAMDVKFRYRTITKQRSLLECALH